MNDPVAHWHAEHVYFGQLLKLLRKEIDVFHSGSDPNYPLMLDIIAYLRDYSDRVHHPREDVAFDRLAKHCPDLQIVLSRLQQEHRVIARAGANLHERLDAILAGEVIAREDVEADAATFLVYYESHIAKEESEVLARAGIGAGQVDQFLLHQANQNLLARIAKSLGVDPGRIYSNIRRLGNTSSASMLIALSRGPWVRVITLVRRGSGDTAIIIDARRGAAVPAGIPVSIGAGSGTPGAVRIATITPPKA